MPNGAPAFYQAYLQEFRQRLQTADHPLPNLQQPPAQADYHFTFGVGGSRLVAVANLQDRWVAVEVYNTGAEAQRRFDRLHDQRADIERDFGAKLSWERQVPNGQASRIRCTLHDVDLEDPATRTRQHEWLMRALSALYHAVVPRLRAP